METERTERQERLRLEQEKKEQEYEDLLWKLHKDKPYEVFNPAQTHEESVAFWTLRVRAYNEHLKQFENQKCTSKLRIMACKNIKK